MPVSTYQLVVMFSRAPPAIEVKMRGSNYFKNARIEFYKVRQLGWQRLVVSRIL